MIVVLDMRDGHLAGPYCAFVEIEGFAEVRVRGWTPQDARRKAARLRRELGPRRLFLGLL